MLNTNMAFVVVLIDTIIVIVARKNKVGLECSQNLISKL